MSRPTNNNETKVVKVDDIFSLLYNEDIDLSDRLAMRSHLKRLVRDRSYTAQKPTFEYPNVHLYEIENSRRFGKKMEAEFCTLCNGSSKLPNVEVKASHALTPSDGTLSFIERAVSLNDAVMAPSAYNFNVGLNHIHSERYSVITLAIVFKEQTLWWVFPKFELPIYTMQGKDRQRQMMWKTFYPTYRKNLCTGDNVLERVIVASRKQQEFEQGIRTKANLFEEGENLQFLQVRK